jgi:tetratricopeptide (TPR) repeat protein
LKPPRNLGVGTKTVMPRRSASARSGRCGESGNEITSRIAVELNLELIAAEAARAAENPDALDYILRGRAAWSKPQGRQNYAETIGSFERALGLDPQSVEAQSRLANVLAGRIMDYEPSSSDSDLKRAEELVSQALAASPRNPFAHFAKGQLRRAQGRHTEAIREYETALASDHNWVVALAHVARCKTFIGPIEEAIPLLEQAIRLATWLALRGAIATIDPRCPTGARHRCGANSG